MLKRAVVCLALIALPFAAAAQAPSPTATVPKSESPKSDTPKAYVPGLEVFMATVQHQHEKLWFAGRARNWPLAAYQLGELKETLGDVQDLVPRYKDLPIADMIDAVIVGPIAKMEAAIDGKDYRAFVSSFDAMTTACNSCHGGAGRGYIRIRRPSRNAFSNQEFRPAR